MDNMKYWNAMARPPKTALKTIGAGRLKGMSNISPQWRYQVMTEQFGMVGFGWKYTITKMWVSDVANDEKICHVSLDLFVKVDGEWSEAIPGEGGSKLVALESKGLFNSDEALKMAVTDALGTAMAKLGVAADIYLGLFDGSKYNDPKPASSEVLPSKDSKPVDEQYPMAQEAQAQSEKVYTKDSLLADTKVVEGVSKRAKLSVPKIIIAIQNAGLTEFTIQKLIEVLEKENK